MENITVRALIARKINHLCTTLIEANWDYKFQDDAQYELYTTSTGKRLNVSYDVLQFGYRNHDTHREHNDIKRILDKEDNLILLQEML